MYVLATKSAGGFFFLVVFLLNFEKFYIGVISFLFFSFLLIHYYIVFNVFVSFGCYTQNFGLNMGNTCCLFSFLLNSVLKSFVLEA